VGSMLQFLTVNDVVLTTDLILLSCPFQTCMEMLSCLPTRMSLLEEPLTWSWSDIITNCLLLELESCKLIQISGNTGSGKFI